MPHDNVRPPIRRVGLVARRGLRAAAPVLSDLTAWLEAHDVQVVLEADTAALAGLTGRNTAMKEDLPGRVGLVVVLGGDGTLLSMADRIAEADADIPILGVNFGSLGFLTEVTLPELYPALESVLDGTAQVDARLMLHGRVRRGDRDLADRLVLNDLVITRGPHSRIIELAVSVGSEFVTRVRADGLIIASPTGSTAYNLACGGPILHPAVDALVLTPVAPHMLTNRPIVIPAAAEVRVEPMIEFPDQVVVVAFDGQAGPPLLTGDTVSVTPAPRPVRIVRASTRTYFEVLRQKLKWGER